MSHKIQQLVNSLVKTAEDSEKLATPIIAAKLTKLLEVYPEDKTIGAMSRVIEKMAQNNSFFIKKSELKSLYNKLYTRNTKFAELFKDELGEINNLSSAKIYERDDAKELNPYEVGDSILSNALNSVFDNTLPVKMYSENLAIKAQEAVNNTLDSLNLKPSKIEVSDGNDKFLVIKADYETPKGVTSCFIPVEIDNKKIVTASVFMGNTGPQELTHVLLKKYLTTFAGNKLKITGSNILGALMTAASENRVISDAEIALIKLNTSRQSNTEFAQNQIVGQKISEASVKDVELPKSDEFLSFEKQFSSPYGQAMYQFGADKVKIARDSILRELVSYGHKNAQITVAKSDNQTIFYSIALDAGKIGFTVPVKIVDSKVNKPTVMLCNGSVTSFNKDSINELYVSNSSDFKAAATASPQFGLKVSDLLKNIEEAVSEGNHDKAEDALNVLASMHDAQAYATGFKLFSACLSKKEPEHTSTCSMVIKNASSEHPICGHTGLPIHKTYQDKQGTCRPLYRKGMEENYEAATFMNSKIFG